jgi:predicted nucleic acid-binding protein
MRVFLDANILVSAAKSDGAVRALLRMLLDRGHDVVADAYVLAEARRNLAAKGPEALRVLEALAAHLSVVATAVPEVASGHATGELAWLPEKDRPVLLAAIGLRCDVLVTADRTHFGAGSGRVYGGVVIHSPRSLAEGLLRR